MARHPHHEPFFPPDIGISPYVPKGPVIPIMPIFADQSREPFRHQSSHFDTESERRYARRMAQHEKVVKGLASLASAYYRSSDPAEYPFDPSFDEAGYQEQPRTHRRSRKNRTHNKKPFFPPGMEPEAQYTSPRAARHTSQRDYTPQLPPQPRVHHRAFYREGSQAYQPSSQQDYGSYNVQPPPEQPIVTGCPIPHGGQIVPLVPCPHNMLGCIVCKTCYHDEQ